jgi:hypothetical protein
MAWMIEHIEFDWPILLSAQDYLIKPLANLGNYLAATGADVLLRTTSISQLSSRRDRRIGVAAICTSTGPGQWTGSRMSCRVTCGAGFDDTLGYSRTSSTMCSPTSRSINCQTRCRGTSVSVPVLLRLHRTNPVDLDRCGSVFPAMRPSS